MNKSEEQLSEAVERMYRTAAKKSGMSFEAYMERLEKNKGRINWRKKEIQMDDGQVYNIREYEEKFEGKKRTK